MSLDLFVYAPHPVSVEQLEAVVAEAQEVRLVGDLAEVPAALSIERLVRGEFEWVASLDGPFVCESEDLPNAVVAHAVGIRVMYHFTIRASPQRAFAAASKLARGLASACGGVVFDAQHDAVTWPRGSTRAFKPPAEDTIDIVEYTWYIRHEDTAADLPESLIARFESMLPEAIPRRFGGFEPLPSKYVDVGVAGFADAWRHEALMLFWTATKPCFGGSAADLGDQVVGPPLPHRVGRVSLTFDRRVFDQDRWRHDLVRLFSAVAETTNAFCAVGEVVVDVVQSRGAIHHTRQSGAGWGRQLAPRGEWHGLPPQDPWLLWLGPTYRRFLGNDDPGAEQQADLTRRSDLPTESQDGDRGRIGRLFRRRRSRPRIPPQARMRIANGVSRHRANDIPSGL